MKSTGTSMSQETFSGHKELYDMITNDKFHRTDMCVSDERCEVSWLGDLLGRIAIVVVGVQVGGGWRVGAGVGVRVGVGVGGGRRTVLAQRRL